MGLLSCAAGGTARTGLISAVQSDTTYLGLRLRVRCNELMALTGGNTAAFGQFDDGTDTNVKMKFWWADAGTGGPKRATMSVPAQGGINNNYVTPTGGGWGTGRYAVIVMGYFGGHMHAAIYDDTGTGTLIDGLAQGSSAWYYDASYVLGTLPVVTGMGQFVLNHAVGIGNYGFVYDSVMVIDALPSFDALPSSSASLLLGGWELDDVPGTAPQTLASYMTGGADPTIVTSATLATLMSGGAEAPTTFTPTTVVATPATQTINGTNSATSVASTEDQFGNTGTLTPTTRTYSATGYSGIITVVVTGANIVITGVTPGTTTITVTDTATGGSGATTASIAVTVTAAVAGVTWTDNNPSIVTSGTGAPTETVTAVAVGSGTITITRNGSSASCVLSVVVSSPGSGNEPSGMTVGLNTGDMTTPPATVAGDTWTEGVSPVTTFFNNFSFVAGKQDPTKIQLAPDGPGIETIYDTNLNGGYNYVGWSCGIVQPTGTLQGVLFLKFLIRARNWNNQSILRGSSPVTNGPLIVSVKVIEPRCGQASENHCVSAWGEDLATNSWLYTLFQNPFNNMPTTNWYYSTDPPALQWSATKTYNAGEYVWYGNSGYRSLAGSNIGHQPPNATYWVEYDMNYANITPNGVLGFDQSSTWTSVQILFGQETTPGVSGDAYYKAWVGALGSEQLAFDSTAAQPGPTWPALALPGGVAPAVWNMLASTSTKGWPSLVFNQTFGGLQPQYSPRQTMYLGLNRLYASTK